MSDFTSEGFKPFPNTHEDAQHVEAFADLTTEAIEYKTNEYGAFLQRTDIMSRARNTGERVLNHLLFEMAFRDGIYDEFFVIKLVDEACNGE